MCCDHIRGQNQLWNAQKLQGPNVCTTEASNWKLYKHRNVWLRQTRFVCWKFWGRAKHNFDINKCDTEKQKKNIAANWVAPPVTLTGQSGNLREHIHGALVGQEKWPTFVLVDMSLSRYAVIYVNVCVCVCPCAIYFRLLFFKGSENIMITRATLLKGWPCEWGKGGPCQIKLQSHASAEWVCSQTGGFFGKSPNMFMPSRR